MKLFYPFPNSVNKCGASCNTIDDPYARVCVPNEVNMNVKVFKGYLRYKMMILKMCHLKHRLRIFYFVEK